MWWRYPSRALLVPLAVALPVAGAVACGGGGGHVGSSSPTASSDASVTAAVSVKTASATASVHPAQAADHAANAGGVTVWGQPASTADRRAVAAVVMNYYAAAAAGDGVAACALIYSIFAEEIAEVYGQPPGPAALRGRTCAVVMSKLFAQQHQQLVSERARLEVSAVRVKGLRGRALLRFADGPEREIEVHRERQKWRIDALLDKELD
jgi:hypothetical protein